MREYIYLSDSRSILLSSGRVGILISRYRGSGQLSTRMSMSVVINQSIQYT